MADHDTQLDTSPTPDDVSPIDDSQLDEATGGVQMIRMSMKYERQNIVFRISSQITRLVYEN